MSILNIQYETSNVRAEEVPQRAPSPPRSRPPVVDNGNELYQFFSLDDLPLPARSQDGVADAPMSKKHPLVQRYITHTFQFLKYRERGHSCGPMAWPWHTTNGRCFSWWVAEEAGLVRRGDSWGVVHRHVESTLNVGELRRPTVKAVFALAALALVDAPNDLVFWGFWGLKSAERTAELVDEVINTHPPLINLPPSVLWTSKASILADIVEIRRRHLPTAVHPIQFISSNMRLFMDDKKSAGSAKRKRVAENVEVAQPPAKKARTATARSSGTKPQVPAGPPRKSIRLVEKANENAAAAAPMAGPPEVPAANPASTGADADNVGAEAGMEIDVETPDVAQTVTQVKPVAAPKRKPRRPVKRLTQRKSTSAHKSRAKKIAPVAPPEPVEAGAPQEVIPCSGPPSSGWIRIPPRPVSGGLASTSSTLAPSTGAAPSPATTTVGTPLPLEGTTCINTPSRAQEDLPKIELDKVDAKLATPAKVSVRASVRIREKKSAKGVAA